MKKIIFWYGHIFTIHLVDSKAWSYKPIRSFYTITVELFDEEARFPFESVITGELAEWVSLLSDINKPIDDITIDDILETYPDLCDPAYINYSKSLIRARKLEKITN